MIKNGRLADGNEPVDILVANDKILSVEKNIIHPVPNTREIDATGYYVLPTMTDITFDFSLLDGFEGYLAGIMYAAGFTSILGIETDDAQQNIFNHRNITPNYAVHADAVQIANHPQSFNPVLLKYEDGVPTFYTTIYDCLQIPTDKYKKLIELCKNEGFTLVIDVKKSVELNGQQHMDAVNSLVEKFKAEGLCKSVFTSIQYIEEFISLKHLRDFADCYFQLFYNPYAKPVEGLTPSTPETITLCLRQNKWTFLSVDPTLYFVRKDTPDAYTLLSSMECSRPLTINEILEFAVVRPMKLMGMDSQRDAIKPGADADICIWKKPSTTTPTETSTQTNPIMTVLCDGMLVYSKTQEITSHEARNIFRRF